MAKKPTGLIIHHDPSNELYLLADSLPKATGVRKAGPSLFVPKSKSHRQYKYFDQGQTPACTGFSCETLLAAAHAYNKDIIHGDEWYALNQAFDRKNGRNYDGGATVTAAMEVGRALGIFPEYRWAYTLRTMQEAILVAPLIAGTYWYDSMFERDSEGIVGVPTPTATTDSGHQYVIGKYDAHQDIWWVRNTWADGDYGIPGDLMLRLVREEGEIAQPTEIKVPTSRAQMVKLMDTFAATL